MEPFEHGERLVVGTEHITYNEATRVDGEIVPYIGGWCLLFPAKLVKEIGPLDEKLAPAFYEDALFCAKAAKAGYRLLGVQAPIHHLYGRTSLDGRFDIAGIHAKNRPYFDQQIRQLRGFDIVGKSVAFFCPGNRPFDDMSLDAEGLGGAESALVQLARALSAIGAEVRVFCQGPDPKGFRGSFEGKRYEVYYEDLNAPIAESLFERDWDAFVLFRCSPPSHQQFWDYLTAERTVFWSCDQYTDMYWREAILLNVDRVVAISPHHQAFLRSHWGVPDEMLTYIDLGVTPSDYLHLGPKMRNRLIYCSVPARGIHHLARIFPRVKDQVPDASLVITADYTLWGSVPGNAEEKELFAGMDGVEFLGCIPRRHLIEHQKMAELHVYPCDYVAEIPYSSHTNAGENFCLASLECQAAGAPTITTPCGALTTTVEQGMSGHLLAGTFPYKEEYDERFAKVVIDLLTQDRWALEKMQEHGRTRALSLYSWERLAWLWAKELFG